MGKAFLLAFLLFLSAVSFGGNAPSDKMMLVVLAGQSNMSGRGFIEDADRVPIPNVYTLDKNGKWIPSVEPTHFERKTCGTCLGRTFARKLHEKHPDRIIGIVPCAVGSSPIETWMPGRKFHHRSGADHHPYDDALRRIKLARQDGEIVAFLWHQGCGNARGDMEFESAKLDYRAKLLQVIRQFREDVPELKEVPFVLGHLKSFRPAIKIDHVNAAIDDIVETEPLSVSVSADGVASIPDKLRYGRRSLQILGERYFDSFETVNRKK
ncbi:MAG: sialate O-acetylesterase [Victivallaceae bacterium]|nr:sialate O-acetylesterase [Victivallaceae bacterium]